METDPDDRSDTIDSPQARRDRLRYVSPESPCPYLPGLMQQSEAYLCETLDGATYEKLMSSGFRRGGMVVYRPVCSACSACVPLRVLVKRFKPTRSMRRVWTRNAEVRVEQDDLVPTDEKHAIYQRYLATQHDGTMSQKYDAFVEFLYDSPAETVEYCYRIGDRLIGVSIVDRCPDGLSTVYMFFEPQMHRRSLGTFSILWEIEHCRRANLPYYYLGYHIADSRTMAYKARFRPAEALDAEHRWIPFEPQDRST